MLRPLVSRAYAVRHNAAVIFNTAETDVKHHPNCVRHQANPFCRGSPGFAQERSAGDESRTRDLNVGNVALYQLSYSRAARAPL